MERILRVNGTDSGVIPADDPGLQLGLTVFETVRCYQGVPFRLEAHLDRLVTSAEAMRMPSLDRDQVRSEILGACREEWRVRYTITAGGNHIVDAAPADLSRVGAPVTAARIGWASVPGLPGSVKHGSRAGWMLTAEKMGVSEVILVGPGGAVLEANRSTVFAVIDGQIITPDLDGQILAGVTRGALLDAAEQAGIPCSQGRVDAAGPFDELYFASTLKELAPVVELDGSPGPGSGPVGEVLYRAFRDLVASET